MKHIRPVLALIMTILAVTLTGCQAVTPGPCTTRNMMNIPSNLVVSEEPSQESTVSATEEESEEETSEEATAEEGTMMKATADINVRKGPSTDDDVVGGLFEGDEVLVVGTDGSWSIVVFEEGHYYAASKYLTPAE